MKEKEREKEREREGEIKRDENREREFLVTFALCRSPERALIANSHDTSHSLMRHYCDSLWYRLHCPYPG